MRILTTLLLTLLPTTLLASPDIHPPIANAYQSTCAIQSNSRTRGTGVLLDNGYVITAAHVVDTNGNGKLDEKERLVELKFYSPKPLEISGWVILLGDPACKHRVDIAVIVPENPIYSKVSVTETPPSIGTPVFTIGHPLGEPPTITDGRISHPNKKGGRSSIPVYSGNSGGGVFLSDSQNLVGIIVRVTVDARRRAFIYHLSEYVHASHITAAMKHLDESGCSMDLLRFMQSMVERQKELDKLKAKKKEKKAPKTPAIKPKKHFH